MPYQNLRADMLLPWLIVGYQTDSSIYGTNTTHEVMVCGVPFPCQKGKSQGHNSPSKDLQCPPHGSFPAFPSCSICGTNTSHEGPMYHALLSGQQSNFKALRAARLVAVAPCLCDRFGPYVAQIKPIRGRSIAQHLYLLGWLTSYEAVVYVHRHSSTHSDRMMNICVSTIGHHCLGQWLVARSVPNHHLHKC